MLGRPRYKKIWRYNNSVCDGKIPEQIPSLKFWHNSRIPCEPYSFRVRIRIKIRVRVRDRIRVRV